MNYWFIIGNECIKFGSGNKYRFFYCDSVELSKEYMYQLIEGKKIWGIVKFEDLFLDRDNGMYSLNAGEYVIHINKRNKIINVAKLDYVYEDIEKLYDVLKGAKMKLSNWINLPMILYYEYWIYGTLCIIGLLYILWNQNLLAVFDKGKKLQLLNEIIKL